MSNLLSALTLMAVVCIAGCSKVETKVQPADESKLVKPVASAILTRPTLNKEPDYKSTPRYCVVAAGQKAQHKLWLVLDDLDLYVDLDSDGDLTDENEKFEGTVESEFEGSRFVNFMIGDLMGEDFWHTDFKMKAAVRPDEVRVTIEMFLDDTIASRTNGHTSAMKLSPNQSDAPVAHFGGAVTLELLPIKFKIGEEVDFNVLVGTAGQGAGSLTSIAHDQIPLGKSPHAEFSFPTSESGDGIGRFSIKSHLEERCWVDLFHSPVRVPENAIKGIATVTLTFEDWEAGKVKAATYEIEVIE